MWYLGFSGNLKPRTKDVHEHMLLKGKACREGVVITQRKAQLWYLCAVQRVRVKGEDHNPECLNSGMGWGTETSSWTNGGWARKQVHV